MASRAMPAARFAVASAYRLPVAAESLAAVISVFGPRPFDEFHRVLRNGGIWVAVTPAEQHLHQLRPPLSETAQRKASDRAQRRSAPPEEAASATRVTYTLQLDDESASDLLHMTPIRWQHDGHEAATTDVREVTVDVWISRSHPVTR
jgi:23S rRNA (guanine745-N1)-methyltransferase